jgi:hypothetical protein
VKEGGKLGLFLNLKMEATCSSETLIDFKGTKQRYIPVYGTLYNHRCENRSAYFPYFERIKVLLNV